MSDFICKVNKAVNAFDMLQNGDKIITALSGGADSVSLLNALIELKAEYNLTIYAAHLNHNLRGDEAKRDEDFVRKLCQTKDIKLFVKSEDIRSLAKQRKQSEELCGRDERYRFFDELSVELGAKVATAHTASDNAETVIFNLTRGAGINGLSGIAPVRDNIIRPLIYVTRDEVEDYCGANNLAFVTDSTNLQDEYTRNKIRHSVIPVLKELNSDFENTIARESDMLRIVNSYIEIKTDEAIEQIKTENGYDSKLLINLPKALRLSVIHKLCKLNKGEVDYKTVKLIDNSLDGGAVTLESGLTAVCKQGTLRFVKDSERDYFSEIELKFNSNFIYKDKEYSVKELKLENENIVFRTRRAGDTFTLPKRNVTKTVKKLLNELKIPEEIRDSLILAAVGSEVLWIEGVGTSDRASGKLIINVKKK
ncbi:MAG: tRNA lysidine(34) synthetase TilS [Ruminococcus sp.]|nr:tRNA lysidine(34) synthetase TilS [Ruminococcus sp.]